ncbi:MAG: hypothetical protein DMG26_07460 [Acidobacteria bacterium]|nr:MAG: hypothetical protein DMG26_07460 [Acidobacteriota bacterium]
MVWPIPFFLIPFILKKVGVAGYGTWAVFLAVISLTSLAEMGLTGTLTKQVAQYYAHKDFGALRRLADTGLMLYAVIALLAVLALELGSRYGISRLLGSSVVSAEEIKVLWHWLCAVVAVNILILPFYSFITGLQRMDLSNMLSYFNSVCAALLTVIFLSREWGLRGLLCANLAAVSLTLILHLWMLRKLLPQVGVNPFRFDLREVKHILSFSVQLYLTQIAVGIHTQIDKLYLAFFTGVGAAGWYNIAGEAAWKVRTVPGLLLTPVMAAASELDARGEEPKIRELYYRSHKYLACLGVPLVLFVAAASKRVVDLWVGPRLSMVAIPLAVLVLANFFNLTSGPGYLILIGQGVLGPGVSSALLGIGVNLTLSFLLTYMYGLTGAVVGTSVALVVATAYFLYQFHRLTKNPFGKLLREAYLKPVVSSLVALTILLAFSPFDGMGWGGLSLQAMIFSAMYFLGLISSRFFDQFDLAKAESLVPIARIARRIIRVA